MKDLKSAAVLAVAMVALSGFPAGAADLSAPVENYAWSGFYFGMHIGAGWDDKDNDRGTSVMGGVGGGGGGGGGGASNCFPIEPCHGAAGGDGAAAGGNAEGGIEGVIGGSGGDGGAAGGGGDGADGAGDTFGGDGGGAGGGGDGGSVTANIGQDDGTDLLSGVHAGYNWQFGEGLVGLEGDYSVTGGLRDYLASARARLGWAPGRFLVYGTGGMAFRGSDDGRAIGVGAPGGAGGDGGDGGDGIGAIPPPVGGDGGAGGAGGVGEHTSVHNGGDDETGWVAGLGIEALLSPSASVGLEGLYYSLGDGDDDVFALRARLNHHFLPDGSPMEEPAAADWSGFYAGVTGGALFSDDSLDDFHSGNGGAGGDGGDGGAGSNQAASAGSGGGGGGGGGAILAVFDNDAFAMAGVHVGYNWQYESWVFGLEGDIAAVEDDLDYLGSVRGRLGWSSGNTLLFATTGVAWARRNELNGASVGAGDGSNGGDGQSFGGGVIGGAGSPGGSGKVDEDNDDETGFVIGAGLETLASKHVSIGMEGLYYFFDASNVDFSSDGEKVDNIDTNNDLFVARARLTFHFSNAAP